MDGGTFTISNGGVFGSLLGTPIINPPQSAILGLHAINDRPVAINGQVRVLICFVSVFPFFLDNKLRYMLVNELKLNVLIINLKEELIGKM